MGRTAESDATSAARHTRRLQRKQRQQPTVSDAMLRLLRYFTNTIVTAGLPPILVSVLTGM